MDVIDDYLRYLLTVRMLSKNTITAYRKDLNEFADFANGRFPHNVDRFLIRGYLAKLQKMGRANATIRRKDSSLRAFFKWAKRMKIVAVNSFESIQRRRPEKNLPTFLSVEEVFKLMDLPKTDNVLGLRDKAILELFYSSGLRLSELISITFDDMFHDGDMWMLKVTGKGNRQRIVPVGKYAVEAIRKYLDVLPAHKNVPIFRNRFGREISGRSVERIVNVYLRQVSPRPDLSVHSLRHTCATHMHNNGCGLRELAQMLGHKSISTTKRYVHLGLRELKKAKSIMEGIREVMDQTKLFDYTPNLNQMAYAAA